MCKEQNKQKKQLFVAFMCETYKIVKTDTKFSKDFQHFLWVTPGASYIELSNPKSKAMLEKLAEKNEVFFNAVQKNLSIIEDVIGFNWSVDEANNVCIEFPGGKSMPIARMFLYLGKNNTNQVAQLMASAPNLLKTLQFFVVALNEGGQIQDADVEKAKELLTSLGMEF